MKWLQPIKSRKADQPADPSKHENKKGAHCRAPFFIYPACVQPVSPLPARTRASKSRVDASRLVGSRSALSRLPASALPSSTPHWSNELIFHRQPCTNTLCSYSAINAPNVAGVSASRNNTFDG